jgi:phytoene dehydrogenase-like protein
MQSPNATVLSEELNENSSSMEETADDRSEQKNADVIIIGAGVGGLSTGAYLAQQGLNVRIFEKLPTLGGFVYSFQRGKYHFEATTHQLMGFGNKLHMRTSLKQLGLDNIDPIKSSILNEFIKFNNRKIEKRYSIPTGAKAIKETLSSILPEQKSTIAKIFSMMHKNYDQCITLGHITRADNIFPHLFSAISALIAKNGKGIFRNLGKYRYRTLFKHAKDTFADVLSFIDNEELRWLLTQYWIYTGVPPQRACGITSMLITYLLFSDGPYLLKGGTQTLVNSLAQKIIENNGHIHRNSAVKSIILEDNQAKGVVTADGKKHYSDYVVSAINTQDTFLKMIDDRHLGKEYIEHIDSLTYSLSGFQVYMGVPFDLRDYGYPAPTYFCSSSYDVSESYELGKQGPSESTSFLLTNFSESELGFTTSNRSSLTIFEVDQLERWGDLPEKEYRIKKEQTQKFLIEKVQDITGLPLKEKAEVVFSATPRTFKHYSSAPNGCMLAAELSLPQSLYKRTNADTPIDGLYLAGSYTMGPGVSTVLDSGITTSKLILKHKK